MSQGHPPHKHPKGDHSQAIGSRRLLHLRDVASSTQCSSEFLHCPPPNRAHVLHLPKLKILLILSNKYIYYEALEGERNSYLSSLEDMEFSDPIILL